MPTRSVLLPLNAAASRLRIFAACAMIIFTTAAQPAADLYVPPELTPWVNWVLHDHPEISCPRAADSGKPQSCSWVNSIDLEVASEATFTLKTKVFRKSRIDLPGNNTAWPTEVTVNGEPVVVIGGGAKPAIVLPAGDHTISGEIRWGQRPKAIELPPHTGIIRLTVDGKRVLRPSRNGNSLLLGKRDSASTTTKRNSLDVDVYRLITDAYPMTIDTTLVLSVAGQPRLIEIGQVLLNDFEVTAFESALPARLNSNGNLEVQIEPGTHRISVRARAVDSPTTLTAQAATPNWPEQEIWGFAPNRNLRLVSLSGASQIDLSQTAAPFAQLATTNLQGYLIERDTALEITVQQRGTPTPPPNRFSVTRDLWLSFDGKGYVTKDQLSAAINHASRLSASYELGRISVNGDDELINSLNGSEPGIELQAGDYVIDAVSRISRRQIESAVGWNLNTDSLRATLHLPPGWRLLWTSGVDNSPDAWLSRWSLWKIFVLVLLGVLAWRFLRPGFSVLLVIATALMMHSAPSLAVVWLILVVLLATVRHLEHEGVLKIVKAVAWVWLGIAALLAISHAVTHARQAVHPQLEHRTALQNYGYNDLNTVNDSMASGELLEEVLVTSGRSDKTKSPSARQRGKTQKPLQNKYTEGLQVQTGPGQPSWRWNRAELYWDGPVSAQQTIELRLMPPWVTRSLNLIIAVLLVGISALLVLPLAFTSKPGHPPNDSTGKRLPGMLQKFAPALLLVMFSAPLTEVKAADQPFEKSSSKPDPTLLKQLEDRLTAKPLCFPNCVSVQRAELNATTERLTIRLSVHSAALVSVPLPTSTVWSPEKIKQNGASATVRHGHADGLHIALEPGRHLVELEGPVGHLERFDLNLPLNPASVATETSGDWAVTGLVNNRVARGTLGFERRVAASVQDVTLKPARAKPYVAIERRLVFGQEWTMQTTVRRSSPAQGGFSLNLPLLENEAVLNNEIVVENDKASLVFGRTDQQIRWNSRLTPANALQLTAPPASVGAARWLLIPSNFWHLDYSGLNPITEGKSQPGPIFLPEANETLRLTLTKTVPVPGSTVTVESVRHDITVGARQQRHQLQLNTLASQGGTIEIGFGGTESSLETNELIGVEVNGQSEPIGLIEGNRLPLPLTPGQTSYTVTWLENTPRSTLFSVAPTTLAQPASNVTTTVAMSRDRWVLLLGGPALGPGILYWGLLLVVLLLAFLITRIPALPFTGADAILLSLGLSLANLPATLLVAVWVIALRFRGAIVNGVNQLWLRNLIQVVSALLSVITLITLVLSVPGALLGSPNMQIQGNGSSAYFYNWFTDQTTNALPTAWVLSLPLWVYRVIMLVWSLWLAFALIRWVPWAWQQWAKPQLWYSSAGAKGLD